MPVTVGEWRAAGAKASREPAPSQTSLVAADAPGTGLLPPLTPASQHDHRRLRCLLLVRCRARVQLLPPAVDTLPLSESARVVPRAEGEFAQSSPHDTPAVFGDWREIDSCDTPASSAVLDTPLHRRPVEPGHELRESRYLFPGCVSRSGVTAVRGYRALCLHPHILASAARYRHCVPARPHRWTRPGSCNWPHHHLEPPDSHLAWLNSLPCARGGESLVPPLPSHNGNPQRLR